MLRDIEPGIYYDMPAEEYHAAHDWLSASGIKRLVPPSTPAHFKAALGGNEHSDAFDIGKAVHTKALGDGDEVIEVDASSWRTKAAQEARAEARAAGKVPVLADDMPTIDNMAAALREHRTAAALLSDGRPEVSLFWVDPRTGVKCRARLDWLPNPVEGRRLIVPDLKTALSAAPSEFAKAAARFGYYIQQEHYRDGIRATGLDADPAFLFVIVEKSPPHLVSVGQFAQRDDLALARAVTDRARRLYAECVADDHWPGYPPGVNDLTLPGWLHYDLEEYAAS